MASSKNGSREQPHNNIFFQNTAIKTIGTMLFSTINLFKKLKRASESKLLNFKNLRTASILSHSLTTTIHLRYSTVQL